KPLRDAPNGPDVRRDVLAGPPVASRRALGQHAVLVGEGARDAVDLQLARVLRARANAAFDARGPCLELLAAECIVEREHRRSVLDRREQVRGRRTDALRWRVRRDELREPLL